ncbi:hypothetical protein, partial [Escherichia coli]|uniref:hypothetical protein n=1 Tax=Escherichia coli TaxID=562 RepID=UPI001BC92617
TVGEGKLMTHDEPCSMAPDDKHDLISGTCSHLPWRYGGKQEMIFSSASVGKYGFGHCDLNLPQSQLFAGLFGKQAK